MKNYIRSITEENGEIRELYRYDGTRLAGRHANAYYEIEQTVENIRARLKAALQALDGLPPASPIPLERAYSAVALSEALSEIEHSFPEVMAWCVYRKPDEEGRWDQIYCGSLTKAHANKMLKAVKRYEAKRERRAMYPEKIKDRLIVQLMPCSITYLVKSTITGAQLTEGWGWR